MAGSAKGAFILLAVVGAGAFILTRKKTAKAAEAEEDPTPLPLPVPVPADADDDDDDDDDDGPIIPLPTAIRIPGQQGQPDTTIPLPWSQKGPAPKPTLDEPEPAPGEAPPAPAPSPSPAPAPTLPNPLGELPPMKPPEKPRGQPSPAQPSKPRQPVPSPEQPQPPPARPPEQPTAPPLTVPDLPQIVVPPAAAQPTVLKEDTAALLKVMLPLESTAHWKRVEPTLKAWQAARKDASGSRLVGDGKFGVKSASAMAEETGLLPLVRFWPKYSQKHKVVPTYQASLRALAETAEEPRKSQLIAASTRERGQAFGRNPGPIPAGERIAL